MARRFLDIVESHSPGLLSGWYVEGYDFLRLADQLASDDDRPALAKYASKGNKSMAKPPQVAYKDWRFMAGSVKWVSARGLSLVHKLVVSCDCLKLSKIYGGKHSQSYKLGAVASQLGLGDKGLVTSSLFNLPACISWVRRGLTSLASFTCIAGRTGSCHCRFDGSSASAELCLPPAGSARRQSSSWHQGRLAELLKPSSLAS